MGKRFPLAPELPYLEVFHTVCREGGFTAAAHRLRCSQPAVSYQVRALERVLRTKLLERGGRRVLLTPAGDRLRSFCTDFFGELARVRTECASGHRLDSLRIGSASGFGRYVLVPALHELLGDLGPSAPELRLWFDSADVVLGKLERGECEATFVYSRRTSSALRYRAVYDEELVLIASPVLAKRLGRPRRLPDLQDAPFVTYEEGDYVFGRWFESAFGDQPATLSSVAHFSELEEVVDHVRRGAGVSIVPRDAAEGARARRAIRILYAGRGTPCINQVFMVTRAGSSIRPELEQLAAALTRA